MKLFLFHSDTNQTNLKNSLESVKKLLTAQGVPRYIQPLSIVSKLSHCGPVADSISSKFGTNFKHRWRGNMCDILSPQDMALEILNGGHCIVFAVTHYDKNNLSILFKELKVHEEFSEAMLFKEKNYTTDSVIYVDMKVRYPFLLK